MSKEARVIDVECQCGRPIARYKKDKKGFLMKMFLDGILEDFTGQLNCEIRHNLNDIIECPGCHRRIANIQMIHGKLAAKVNHGVVKKIQT